MRRKAVAQDERIEKVNKDFVSNPRQRIVLLPNRADKLTCANSKGRDRFLGTRNLSALTLLGRLETRNDMALACYLDDSGSHEESSVITIAGFVAPVGLWAEFEMAARTMFDSYGISCLHTRDFHATKGEFDGWRGIKKRSFCDELALHLHHLYPFGVSISCKKSTFTERKTEFKAWPNLSVFGQCFDRLILRTYEHIFYENGPEMWHKDMNISVMMESGNKNNNNALECFNSLKHHEKLERLSSMTFVGKNDCIAVQAADFLAFYSRRWMDSCTKADKNTEKPEMLRILSDRLHVVTEGITDYIRLDHKGVLPGDDWKHRLIPPR